MNEESKAHLLRIEVVVCVNSIEEGWEMIDSMRKRDWHVLPTLRCVWLREEPSS